MNNNCSDDEKKILFSLISIKWTLMADECLLMVFIRWIKELKKCIRGEGSGGKRKLLIKVIGNERKWEEDNGKN